jgi:uncharacterized protein (DUF2237 family)
MITTGLTTTTANMQITSNVAALVSTLVRGGALVFAVMAASVFFASAAVSLKLDATEDSNVFGTPLQKCDRTIAHDPNFPATGFMRTNMCTATSMDAGSHYVCVNLPSATVNGKPYSTFWTETKQAQSAEEATTWPLGGPWCICEWAFARMLSQHPDFEKMLNCPAINEWTIEYYWVKVPDQLKELQAVCRKCDFKGQASKQSLKDKCTEALDLN